jgi:hypothetical protein
MKVGSKLTFLLAGILCQQIFTNTRFFDDLLSNLFDLRNKITASSNIPDDDNNIVSRNLYKYALLGELAVQLLGLKNEKTASDNTSNKHDDVRVGFC